MIMDLYDWSPGFSGAPIHVNLNCNNQIQTRTHHLQASDVEIITDIGMAQAKICVGSNIFDVRSQVQYSKVWSSFLDEEFSDTDKLINFLENQWHSHVILFHQNHYDSNQEPALKI